MDGFLTRTPFQSQVDFEASYQVRMGGARRLTVLADFFNLFNQQIVQDYDTWTTLTFGGPQIQAPREIRLGLRYTF